VRGIRKDNIEISQLGINNIVQLFLLDGFILIYRHSHGYILGDEGKKGFQELLYNPQSLST
jgi:hypothetical protein